LKIQAQLVEANLFCLFWGAAILSFLGLTGYVNLQYPKLRFRGYNALPVVVFDVRNIIYIYLYLIPFLKSRPNTMI